MPAAINTGSYLECNAIFSFADSYLLRGVTPGSKYISPGMQALEYLKGRPPAAVFTSRFDPLKDVRIKCASKMKAGVEVSWRHHEILTHGRLQMTAWSIDCGRFCERRCGGIEEHGLWIARGSRKTI